MAHDVFISYSHHDKPTADAVCAKLEEDGIDTTIVNGKIVYRKGAFSGGLSEEELIREAAAEVRKMME